MNLLVAPFTNSISINTSVFGVPRFGNLGICDVADIFLMTFGAGKTVITMVENNSNKYPVWCLANPFKIIKLSELLEQLDLTGNIESWQVSNSTLFDVCLGNNEEPSFDYYSDEEGNEFSTPTNIGDIPYLVSFEPFDTTEWLKVVIDGIEYEIVVTD
mgnify:CR=1 FL=1